jgi:serine protease AprX
VEKLLYRYHLDNERQVIEQIKKHNPGWAENDGACSRCVDYYHTEIVMEGRILPEIGPYFPVKSADDYIILPTPLRMDAEARFTGKGVTICFIDSGFSPHPDLTTHQNRIKKIIDITRPGDQEFAASSTASAAWHGTMTSVVCAGDGYLSNGLYRGIASRAELVLIKVQDETGHIATRHIVKALEWVLENHAAYNIRVVNMSLGGDEPVSYIKSEIDQLAEKLVGQGITVVAAAGNDENGLIKPPANSPHVITVGGLDDNNRLEQSHQLYHSTYGITADGLMKPDLVAPAIWIAAPILPGTAEQNEAAILYDLLAAADHDLTESLLNKFSQIKLEENLLRSADTGLIRESVIRRIQSCKYISAHYMHVDGTSFAAPITSAVIAQMLEANPELGPADLRELLFSTAKRIPGFPAERQGFGVLSPGKALLKTIQMEKNPKLYPSPHINGRQKTIEFFIRHNCASKISLAGSFNHWAQDVLLMEPCEKGLWKIRIPLLPAGKYQYKFFVDDKIWLEDVDNPWREPDGFHGFNSILFIEN